jgi:hypothetical protein
MTSVGAARRATPVRAHRGGHCQGPRYLLHFGIGRAGSCCDEPSQTGVVLRKEAHASSGIVWLYLGADPPLRDEPQQHPECWVEAPPVPTARRMQCWCPFPGFMASRSGIASRFPRSSPERAPRTFDRPRRLALIAGSTAEWARIWPSPVRRSLPRSPTSIPETTRTRQIRLRAAVGGAAC